LKAIDRIRRLLTLTREIKKAKPDVILSFLTNVNVAAIITSKLTGIPVVVSERIYPPYSPVNIFYRIARKWLYPLANCVVVQTDKGNEWLRSNIPRAKSLIIPNPIQNPLSQTEPYTAIPSYMKKRRILLAVGRLNHQKGFDLLIEAFSVLSKTFSEWDLVIIGEGEERTTLEEMVFNLALERRIKLIGRAGNLADWYSNADLFVMSSRYEGFPNTLLEAMSHGLASVSVDCISGPSDMIKHAENGLLVNQSEQADELVNALSLIMSDEGLRKKIGENARQINELYQIDLIASQWCDVLDLNS
jgi:glycosyltransferase involved in cell wall biosynthesis